MAVNPLHSVTTNVFIFAVIRASDKSVLASFVRSKEVTVEGVRECVATNAGMSTGKRYTAQGESQSIHYTLDANGRVYAIVTVPKYPPRIAFTALEEMKESFQREFGPKLSTATENTLTKASSSLFRQLYDKYEFPGNVDKMAQVHDKIEVVKSTMKENIQQLLLNEEKLERIETAAVQLNEQAGRFKEGSKELSNKMWWKMWKMRLLIGGLIVAVLIILIVPVAVSNSNNSK